MTRRTITPEMAASILGNNHETQRKVSKARVRKYKELITEGLWLYNGESIIVSTSGKLIDGQHRLLAVVEAGLPIDTVLVSDVPDEQDGIDTFLTINSENRSNTDALFISGFKTETQNITKLVKLVAAFENKKLHKSPNGFTFNNLDIVESAKGIGEPRLLRVIERAKALSMRCSLLNTSYWLLLVYIFEGNSKGNAFLEDVAECSDTDKTQITALLNYLENFITSNSGGGAKITKLKWIGLFKAYNAYLHDLPLKVIRQSPQASIEYPISYEDYFND